jgi:predicted helicase
MINIIDKFNSFDDFYVITKNLNAKQKGDLFEEFTKYIFMFHDDFIGITKQIWLLKDVPLHVLEKLNMPTKDYGIDLVMQDVNDSYYSIQSKFRMDVNDVINWNDLSTFFGLSFGVATGFDKG